MSYKVNFFDPKTPPISVVDAKLNVDTHLTFVGKNWYGYGETIAENQLNLMENFAHARTGSQDKHPTEAKAVEGQIYYNKDLELYYYFFHSDDDNTKEWRVMPGSTLKVRTVIDTNNVPHTITVGYDIDDVTDINVPVYCISTSVTSSLTYIDLKLTDNANDQDILTAFGPKIYQGMSMTQTANYKFHGTATTAQYADLAELYVADAEYEPGTVVKIGGEAEVTQTVTAFDPGVFGIVSTAPAHLMNSGAEGTTVPVALAGRVPLKVIGPVKKGQRLLSSEEPGVARAPTDYEMQEYMDWYRIVGRALEDKETEAIGLVEVVVGSK